MLTAVLRLRPPLRKFQSEYRVYCSILVCSDGAGWTGSTKSVRIELRRGVSSSKALLHRAVRVSPESQDYLLRMGSSRRGRQEPHRNLRPTHMAIFFRPRTTAVEHFPMPGAVGGTHPRRKAMHEQLIAGVRR